MTSLFAKEHAKLCCLIKHTVYTTDQSKQKPPCTLYLDQIWNHLHKRVY